MTSQDLHKHIEPQNKEQASKKAQLCFHEYSMVQSCVLFWPGNSSNWSACILELLLKSYENCSCLDTLQAFTQENCLWHSCVNTGKRLWLPSVETIFRVDCEQTSFEWSCTQILHTWGHAMEGVFMWVFKSISCVIFRFLFPLTPFQENERTNHNTL